jgi:hypothetical protein
MQLLDVGFVEAELGGGGRDLGVREHADLPAACEQTLDLFKLLKSATDIWSVRDQPASLNGLMSVRSSPTRTTSP